MTALWYCMDINGSKGPACNCMYVQLCKLRPSGCQPPQHSPSAKSSNPIPARTSSCSLPNNRLRPEHTNGLTPFLMTFAVLLLPALQRSMQSQGSIAGSVRFMPGERSPSRPPSRQTSLSGMPRPVPLTGLGLASPPSALTSPTGMPVSYSMMPSPRSLAPELSHGSLGTRTLSGSLRQQHHPYSSPPPQPNHIVEIYTQGSGEARNPQ